MKSKLEVRNKKSQRKNGKETKTRRLKRATIPRISTPITTANEPINPFKQCPQHEKFCVSKKGAWLAGPAFLIIAQHLKSFWGGVGSGGGLLPTKSLLSPTGRKASSALWIRDKTVTCLMSVWMAEYFCYRSEKMFRALRAYLGQCFCAAFFLILARYVVFPCMPVTGWKKPIQLSHSAWYLYLLELGFKEIAANCVYVSFKPWLF